MEKSNQQSFWRDQFFPRIIFPAYMGGCLYAVYALLQNGVNEGIAVFGVLVPGAIGIGILERILPFRPTWNKGDGDFRTDFIHALVAQIALPRIIKPLWVAMLVPVSVWLSSNVAWFSWPHEWPLLAQLFLMLLIAEFGRYWVHRAAHEVSWLWRFHAVHHSPNRLYWLNAARFHPVEKVFFLIPEVIPFILLDINVETASLYFVFNGIHGLFQHSNIKIKLGPLNYLIAMCELHRWHHSKIIEQSNKNYGNNLIVWDIVFGTFYLPKNKEVASIGLLNPSYPKGYLAQLAAPFRKGKLDKPADYKERSAHYHEQVKKEAEAFDSAQQELGNA